MIMPRHIGIIMDGNGRWAEKKGLPKIMGHRAGVKTAERIIEECGKRGIRALTLYTFSSENWKRPKEEVDSLMRLFEENLKEGRDKLHSNKVRFRVIGRLNELPSSLRAEIAKTEELTSGNTGLGLTLAVNYGSRQEIVDAARSVCRQVISSGLDADSINEEVFSGHLYTKNLPELDLVIRTSGEMRLSNFLLWQAAYAEIYVTDVLWPDFKPEDLERALADFEKRERRFGA